MEEDENNDGKSLCTSNCRLIASQRFRFSNIFRKMINRTLAILTIASYTLNTAAASYYQTYGNNNNNNYKTGLNDFMSTRNDSDYYDSFDEFRRIYENVSLNTPIEKSIRNNNFINKHSDSDNINNRIMANVMSNISVTTVTSTMSAIKSNASNVMNSISFRMSQSNISGATTEFDVESTPSPIVDDQNNYWALFALVLVVGTAAGNILVCLAITWERRLQNVTNYFLMSLAITDLMVAILVMPLGILSLVKGK